MIVDTGPLVAAANAKDPHSRSCRELLVTEPGPLVVPALVVAEAAYLIAKYLGAKAEAALLRSLATDRFRVEGPTPADLRRSAELVVQYADLPLGATDASVVALAERLAIPAVATLDRRHFTIVRPAHVDSLTLLP